jgi:hypothetical protein
MSAALGQRSTGILPLLLKRGEGWGEESKIVPLNPHQDTNVTVPGFKLGNNSRTFAINGNV